MNNSKVIDNIISKLWKIEQDTRQFVRDSMVEIVMAGLGITADHDKVSFNRTNGFQSKLAKLVEELAKQTIKEDALKHISKIAEEPIHATTTSSLKDLFMKEFKLHYKHAFEFELNRLLQEREEKIKLEIKTNVESFFNNIDMIAGPVIDVVKAEALEHDIRIRNAKNY